jgi:hypothetical protein
MPLSGMERKGEKEDMYRQTNARSRSEIELRPPSICEHEGEDDDSGPF